MGPGHDVLALRVEHDVAVQDRLAGGRVAREQDARPRVDAAVPEDHRLHRDGRAEIVGDPFASPVGPRPVAVPRPEDRLDREAELGPRVVRHLRDAHHVPEHRREALAAVPRELLAAGRAGQPGRRRVRQAQVQDRVHHPGHRDRSAGPNADQERRPRPAERLIHQPLDPGHVLAELGVQAVGPAMRQVFGTGRGRDRERRWHGQAEVAGHDGQVGGLAAQEPLDLGEGKARALIAIVDVAHVTAFSCAPSPTGRQAGDRP